MDVYSLYTAAKNREEWSTIMCGRQWTPTGIEPKDYQYQHHVVFGIFFLRFIIVSIFIDDFCTSQLCLYYHHSRYLPHALLRFYRPYALDFFIYFLLIFCILRAAN